MFKWGLFQECKFGLPFEIRVSHILRNKHKCMITSVGTKKVFERIQYLMKEKKIKEYCLGTNLQQNYEGKENDKMQIQDCYF